MSLETGDAKSNKEGRVVVKCNTRRKDSGWISFLPYLIILSSFLFQFHKYTPLSPFHLWPLLLSPPCANHAPHINLLICSCFIQTSSTAIGDPDVTSYT